MLTIPFNAIVGPKTLTTVAVGIQIQNGANQIKFKCIVQLVP